MSKKFLVLGVFVLLILVALGGFFWWWQYQEDVRELNKDLPEGVRVVKSLAGEYRVVNEIDGYEFMVPEEWMGLEEIEYNANKAVKELEANFSGIGLEGKKGYAKLLSVDVYTLDRPDIDLEQWANKLWDFFELEGNLVEENVGYFNIIKAFEEKNLGGTYVYFLKKNNKVYVFNNGLEELLREVIVSGEW